jgi:hypothetical protein
VSFVYRNPDDVVLCVLVDNKRADPGIQIHCRLIEAFCWEFPIPLIKVLKKHDFKLIQEKV